MVFLFDDDAIICYLNVQVLWRFGSGFDIVKQSCLIS